MHKYLPQSKVAEWREQNTPEVCPLLGHALSDPVVDHDHKSGMVRAVISRQGNALLGKVENFFKSRCGHAECDLPDVLINMANYLRNTRTEVLHHVGARQLTSRFANNRKGVQVGLLVALGENKTEVTELKNTRERSKRYRDLITGKISNESVEVTQAI